ncbi:MAG: bifunctional hydroxymethylpyrimidine kinase/phosphomethylpyrimidine kinase, partial [Methanobrevibacter sp.]|nr:bifunctional hydroxymethylpyrimidine kinase/phosphomethylpyrimidine kinase [Methanobrevibacter sp.]
MIGLTIAGFDPSGGAGISTDIKTMGAHGVHGCAAVTALTAQNPKKVFSVEPVSTTYISEQIDSIFDEYAIKYSKTGLLYSKEIIQLVSKKVDEYDLSIVVDPVMVASAGDALGKSEIADA